MARVLGEESHSLVVHDPVSGSAVTLYYRRPTSEERVAYQLSAFRLEGGQRRFCLGETRLKFGLEILTGFGSGDFLVAENGGHHVSSNWRDPAASIDTSANREANTLRPESCHLPPVRTGATT